MNIKAELEALRYEMEARDAFSKEPDARYAEAELADIISRLPPDAVVVRDVGMRQTGDSNETRFKNAGIWVEGWNACRRAMLSSAEENSDDRG